MTARDSRYHHGDLPDTLRRVAAELVAERGVAGFSLREVARRAGVSHAAPAHHYGDAAGLLTAVAVEGFEHLSAALSSAAGAHEDPVDRLVAVGRAYVEVSQSNPGHCAVMFRHDVLCPDVPEYLDAGARSYEILEDAVRDVATSLNPELDVETASRLCWSTMQGLIDLHPRMVETAAAHGLPEPAGLGATAEVFGRMLVNGLRGS